MLLAMGLADPMARKKKITYNYSEIFPKFKNEPIKINFVLNPVDYFPSKRLNPLHTKSPSRLQFPSPISASLFIDNNNHASHLRG